MAKKMTFQQAKDKLKKLAKGRYHYVSYELTEFHTGETKTEVAVYIDGRDIVRAATYAAAFVQLEGGSTEAIPEVSA